ncbi:hypothetical protein BJ684DRAFT_14780 [Piptocephalis cylindrospora]|uniref:Ricin B lectin domain-containing protein n=1 Tax=Piptocephalis cylindrospora TaxID=1907219 RepID=A0A4P9YA51_9FUNG|nr:hypothetical protein BJ684DRAFT_14780 [Piptocephalis cylindrospora]|eukprot:RKP14930.1 hypothetical protein BJ684DRAFT_14780 [Piptocephalis cylindrospora]
MRSPHLFLLSSLFFLLVLLTASTQAGDGGHFNIIPAASSSAASSSQPTPTSSSSDSSATGTSHASTFGDKADKKQNYTGSITELFLPPLNAVMQGNASTDQKNMVAELIHLDTGLMLSSAFFSNSSAILGLVTSEMIPNLAGGYYVGRWSINTQMIQLNIPQLIVESSMTSDSAKSFLCLSIAPDESKLIILGVCNFKKSPKETLWTIGRMANDPTGSIFQIQSSSGKDVCLGFPSGSPYPSLVSCTTTQSQWTYFNVDPEPVSAPDIGQDKDQDQQHG